MFYLKYVMFLFAGHSGLSGTTTVDSWGAARSGAALDSCIADGQRGRGEVSRGVGHPQGA
jgi:hypothetical protein